MRAEMRWRKVAMVGFGAGIILAGWSWISIYAGVRNNCRRATEKFGGKCAAALMQVIADEQETVYRRNSAIWALGQLAQKESLPFLYQLRQGVPLQERCKWDGEICRYEIEKAIRWSEKGNITNWMYGEFR